jgi:hypothetical protein
MSKSDIDPKKVKATAKIASIASESMSKAAPVVSEAFINDAYEKQKARDKKKGIGNIKSK